MTTAGDPTLPQLVGQTLLRGHPFNRVAATRHTGLASGRTPPIPHPLASEHCMTCGPKLRVSKSYWQERIVVH